MLKILWRLPLLDGVAGDRGFPSIQNVPYQISCTADNLLNASSATAWTEHSCHRANSAVAMCQTPLPGEALVTTTKCARSTIDFSCRQAQPNFKNASRQLREAVLMHRVLQVLKPSQPHDIPQTASVKVAVVGKQPVPPCSHSEATTEDVRWIPKMYRPSPSVSFTEPYIDSPESSTLSQQHILQIF